MSVTISNCNEICNSPTNVSPSKMLYSFPKTARFNTRKVILCDRYYDIPSTVNSCRSTTLGIGHKYDFTQEYVCRYLVPLKIHLLILMRLKEHSLLMQPKDLALGKEGKKCKQQGLWLRLKWTKTQGQDLMKLDQPYQDRLIVLLVNIIRRTNKN